MLNDSQKLVFRAIADNKAMFECLKEYLEGEFMSDINPDGLTNEQLGAIARAKFEGLKVITQAFAIIKSCKTVDKSLANINPAR